MQNVKTQSGPANHRPTSRSTHSHTALNVPNTLTLLRLLGSPLLIVLAINGNVSVIVGVFIFLILTDWLDGKLASLLNQRTELGARLDSAADAVFFGSLLFAICLLKWEFVSLHWPWIAAALVSYAATSTTGWIKFRRLPSYHTWAAKTSWHLVNIAVLCLFTGWASWPFFIAMSAVVLTNAQATTMTIVMRHWQADVPSIYHVFRRRRSLQC